MGQKTRTRRANEVKRIIDESYEKVKSMLNERRGLLKRVANTLLEKGIY